MPGQHRVFEEGVLHVDDEQGCSLGKRRKFLHWHSRPRWFRGFGPCVYRRPGTWCAQRFRQVGQLWRACRLPVTQPLPSLAGRLVRARHRTDEEVLGVIFGAIRLLPKKFRCAWIMQTASSRSWNCLGSGAPEERTMTGSTLVPGARISRRPIRGFRFSGVAFSFLSALSSL